MVNYFSLPIFSDQVHGVELDTSFFTGNFTPRASVQVCTKKLEVSPILRYFIIYVFFKGARLSSSPALLPRKVLDVVTVRAL